MTPSEPPFQGGSNDVWVSGSPPWTKGRYSPPIADGAVPSELPERHFVAWRPMHVAPCMHASQHLLLHGHPAATKFSMHDVYIYAVQQCIHTVAAVAESLHGRCRIYCNAQRVSAWRIMKNYLSTGPANTFRRKRRFWLRVSIFTIYNDCSTKN